MVQIVGSEFDAKQPLEQVWPCTDLSRCGPPRPQPVGIPLPPSPPNPFPTPPSVSSPASWPAQPTDPARVPQKRARTSIKANKDMPESRPFLTLYIGENGRPRVKASASMRQHAQAILAEAIPRFVEIVLPSASASGEQTPATQRDDIDS